ncbi:MAG: hypothetical protein NVV66_16405 [Cellulomonas sp.]|uniref:hypothetical protein n=1 Tax=Cellulomonas sp. TaxID=40001 RepID=UPI0025841653|nr:hypothetical protein [Cellulomonas sp.]MCR6706197.1 hypothetical protein [Cellulomonas sp.]
MTATDANMGNYPSEGPSDAANPDHDLNKDFPPYPRPVLIFEIAEGLGAPVVPPSALPERRQSARDGAECRVACRVRR